MSNILYVRILDSVRSNKGLAKYAGWGGVLVQVEQSKEKLLCAIAPPPYQERAIEVWLPREFVRVFQ